VRRPITILIPTLAAALLLAACGSSSSSKSTSSAGVTQPAATTSSGQPSAVVKTARNAALGTTVLVNSQGMTLYHLSGEQNGKFICTSSACVGIWHPLTVASGSTPSGVESLGVVKRPDGTEQVTYKGTPLYSFAPDTKEGEAKGQGVKDVGTWTAVTVTTASSSAPATNTPTSPPSSSGGGYAY
jgi:predicted lipoprotein with Yx(FWY)xxD motif